MKLISIGLQKRDKGRFAVSCIIPIVFDLIYQPAENNLLLDTAIELISLA